MTLSLIQWAFSSSILLIIILLLRALLRGRASQRLIYGLWLIGAARLMFSIAFLAWDMPWAAASLAQPVEARLETQLIPEHERKGLAYEALIPSELVTWEEIPKREDTYLRVPLPYDHAPLPPNMTVDEKDVIYRTVGVSSITLEDKMRPLWRAGATAVGGVILLSNLLFSRKLKKRRKPLEVQGCPLPVYTVEGLSSPCLFGGSIYLTPEAAADERLREYALAHELTHWRHRDWYWSLVRCGCLTLHWYNPLVWLAAWLSKGDGELACDADTVRQLGEDRRLDYGRALVDLAARRGARPGDLLSLSTAMTGGGKTIRRRVLALVKNRKTARIMLVLAAGALCVSAAFAFGAGPSRRPPLNFQHFLARAQAIQYCPPLYWNILYPDPITDPDLLIEAKRALSGVTYLEARDPQPNLSSEELIRESRIILTLEGGQMDYSLLWQNDYTYLFPGDILQQSVDLREEEGDTAQLQGVSGTMISQPGVNLIDTLQGLAQLSTRKNEPDGAQPITGNAEKTPATYETFLDRAEGAVSIRIETGDGALTTISDPQRLEEARTALLAAEHLPEDADDLVGISEVFLRREVGTGLYAITFTGGTGETATYYINRRPMTNTDYLIFPVKDFPVENEQTECSFDRLGVLPSQASYALMAELARTNGTLSESALPGSLTPEQIAQVNEAFRSDVDLPDGGTTSSEISCFFTSSYDDPTQIDLEEFLMYCPLREEVGNRVDPEEAKECQAVLEAAMPDVANDPEFTLPTPMWRYPREKVSALLQKYAGVTVEELDWSGATYLKEYDAFYNFTSDFGPGFFPCAGGRIDGDTVLLWSDPTEEGDRCELVLRKSGDRYLIRSHHTVYER